MVEVASDERSSYAQRRADDSPHGPQRASEAEAREPWDDGVLADMLSLEYTEAVIVTNGSGQTLHAHTRGALRKDLAEIVDVAHGALVQSGKRLDLDELQLTAAIYRKGTLVAATSGSLRVVVLASGHANLGQLISQVRRALVVRS